MMETWGFCKLTMIQVLLRCDYQLINDEVNTVSNVGLEDELFGDD